MTAKHFNPIEEARTYDIKLKDTEALNAQITTRVCRLAMLSINLDVHFTVETADDYDNGRLPSLKFRKKGFL